MIFIEKLLFQLLIHPCPAMYLLYIGWPVLNQLAVASFYFSLAEPLRPKVYAALLLGYTIHFIYCIWGNLRITVAELIAAMPRHCAMLLATEFRMAVRG